MSDSRSDCNCTFNRSIVAQVLAVFQIGLEHDSSFHTSGGNSVFNVAE